MNGGAAVYILRCADGSYYNGITRADCRSRCDRAQNQRLVAAKKEAYVRGDYERLSEIARRRGDKG